MNKIKLESSRLILREIKQEDWQAMHVYCKEEKFSKFEPWGPNTEEDSKNFAYQKSLQIEQDPRREFDLAITLKDDDTFIGSVGIRMQDPQGSYCDLGYSINPKFQGKGYVTEAASRLIQFGFEKLNLDLIYAICDEDNHASYAVMERLGMKKVARLENHKEYKDKIRHFLRYEIIRP